MSEALEQGSGVEEPKVVSVDEFNELKAQMAQLAQSKDRILEESKSYKSKYQSVQREREEREKAELESKEEWKVLLEQEREKSAAAQRELETAKKQAVLKEVNYQVARLANDAHDANDVVNSLNLTEGHVDFETGKVDGVASLIDDLRKNKPYLFKQDVPQMNTKMPHFKEEKKELSNEQKLEAAFKTLLKPN